MLEMEKLKSEIAERESRANENAVDIRMKNARAAVDEARVAEINSKTDMSDLEFTRKATGEDHYQKMQEKDHDRDTQAGLKAMEGLTKQ